MVVNRGCSFWIAAAGLVLAAISPAVVSAQKGLPAPDPNQPADIIIVDAMVWPGAGLPQPEHPSGIAITKDRITAVGPQAYIKTFSGPATRIISAGKNRVIPGITDSHTHMISGGFQLDRLDLRETKDRDDFVGKIAAAAKDRQEGEWVLGGRWSVESWAKPEPPRAAWIDPMTGETPVFLSRMDGHQALVNSAALKLAGITAEGPADPVGGEIERDAKTRQPTGILKESAMGLVSRHIPKPSMEDQHRALVQAMKHANSLGITSVHDMCDWDDLEIFAKAEGQNLTVRIAAYVTSEDWESQLDRLLRIQKSTRSPMLKIAGFKGYMDGSLGSRTAYMKDRFADATPEMPYPRGQLTAFAVANEALQKHVAALDASGLQAAVHAIGDQANHLLLDAYEVAAKQNSTSDRLHRIEHAQHLLVPDIPRFAGLRVVASMQPYHKADDGRYAEKALGSARLKGSYAFKQLVDAGALLAFGSDWPVVDMNPFLGIDSAVNARTLTGEVWLPEHSITVEQALHAYTLAPAKAIHRDKELGTIEPGKLADLVILMSDPLTAPSGELRQVKPVMTILGGKVVHPPES